MTHDDISDRAITIEEIENDQTSSTDSVSAVKGDARNAIQGTTRRSR